MATQTERLGTQNHQLKRYTGLKNIMSNDSGIIKGSRYPYYVRIHTRDSLTGRASDVHEAGKNIIISAHTQSDWQMISNRDIDGINTDSPEYMQSLIGN